MAQATLNEEEANLKKVIKHFSKENFTKDDAVKGTLFIFASIATIFIFFIIIFLFFVGGSFFFEVPITDFLFGKLWNPKVGWYGALPLILGSVLVSFGAMIFAVPIGIATAIFISEIAPPRLSRILKATVEILAGIPSVVYGFFGIIVLNTWLKDTFLLSQGNTWLSGSIILGIMILPTIVSVCEDAFNLVPQHYREGSLAMGATKWQTIRRVVLPAAVSGITAAIILGLGRAIGETMAVMMITGNCAVIPNPIWNIFSCLQTITAAIGTELGESPAGSLHRTSLFALAIVLFIITFIINTLANLILSRLQKKIKGKTITKKRISIFSKIKSNIGIKYDAFRDFLTKNKKFNVQLGILIIILANCLAIVYSFLNGQFEWFFITLLLSGFFLFNFLRKENKYMLKIIMAFLIFFLIQSWFNWQVAFIITSIFIGYIIVNRICSVNIRQKLSLGIVTLSTFIVLVLVGIILYYIIVKGLPAISMEFLTETPRDLGREGGIMPAIVGTIFLTLGAIAFAVPIGIISGIYLSEYAKESKITKIIRSGIDNLNGTPSIVFGLFGFLFFVVYCNLGVSALAGSLTLGLMILPTIIKTTEETVKNIPQSFREGSLALGSTKWQAISKVVLPAAIPGIITGVVLGMGRAAGETAPILFTAVVFTKRYLPRTPMEPVMALTFHLFILSTEVPDASVQAAGTALVLLFIVLIFYSFAFIIRNRYAKKKQW